MRNSNVFALALVVLVAQGAWAHGSGSVVGSWSYRISSDARSSGTAVIELVDGDYVMNLTERASGRRVELYGTEADDGSYPFTTGRAAEVQSGGLMLWLVTQRLWWIRHVPGLVGGALPCASV